MTTGELAWRNGKRVSRFEANAPTSVAGGGCVYAGPTGIGSGMVQLNATTTGVSAEEVYCEARLPTAICGSVTIGDYLYGTTGRSM